MTKKGSETLSRPSWLARISFAFRRTPSGHLASAARTPDQSPTPDLIIGSSSQSGNAHSPDTLAGACSPWLSQRQPVEAPTPIVHVDVRNSNIFPEANKIQLDDLDNLIQELRFNVANRKAELDQESMINVQAVIDELDNRLGGIEPTRISEPLQRLRGLCRYSQLTPSALTIQDEDLRINPKATCGGAAADVHQGQLRARDGQSLQLVAVKVLRLHSIDAAKIREKVTKAYYCEMVVWRWLNHPNIVTLHGVANAGPSESVGVGLVSTWMKYGTILTYVNTYPNIPRTALVFNMVHGLKHLHDLKLVHGDLKGSNVLINDQGHACLTDFGLTEPGETSLVFTLSKNAPGTERWMSPELLLPDGGESETENMESSYQLTEASDRYALAMTMWETYTGVIPFHKILPHAAVSIAVLRGIRPKRNQSTPSLELTDSIWNVMEMSWEADPKLRPSLKAIEIALHYC